MRLIVNGKERDFPGTTSLRQVAGILQLPEKGVAMAVNNRMVQRKDWETVVLKENDSVVIIKAACGG